MRFTSHIGTIARAAWPGLVVFVAHAVLGERFSHEPIVDPIAHFSGGCAVAFAMLILMRDARPWFGQLTRLTHALVAIGVGSLIALAWELGELTSDLIGGTHIQSDAHNTLRDLALGVTGACVVTLWRVRRLRRTVW